MIPASMKLTYCEPCVMLSPRNAGCAALAEPVGQQNSGGNNGKAEQEAKHGTS